MRDKRDGQAHSFRPADSSDPVNVVRLLVRQRHVDDVRQPLDVQTPGGDVGADQKLDLVSLKGEKLLKRYAKLIVVLRSASLRKARLQATFK